MLKKLLEIAVIEVGYIEKKSNASLDDKTANAGSNNYTKYWRDADSWWKWNINGSNSQANPWCACFVSWCFHQAGIEKLIVPFYYCPTGVNNFKKAGQWVTSNPQAGDVIFYKDSSGVACHVGLVEKVEGGKVYTIEGNTSSAAGVVANGGCVARKSYALTYGSILGYGRPKYVSEIQELTTPNDITWELSNVGIVLDKQGLMDDIANEPNGRLYWLARKLCHKLQLLNGKGVSVNVSEYTDVGSIVWDLGYRGIVIDKDGMTAEINANPNGRLYWLARKGLHYLRQRD